MHFPRYWAQGTAEGINGQGKQIQFSCWGWSDESADAAEQLGRERAARALERSLAGDALQHYGYGERPLREEVLQQIKELDGDVEGIITRNAYGCRVLNTSSAMFVDIDFQEKDPRETFGAKLKGLFGKKEPAEDPREIKAVTEIEMRLKREPGIGARLYRTKAGIRILFTHAAFKPESDDTVRWMETLGADPLYVKLCKTQKCFRARLTPKPWRCGVGVFRASYPWANEKIRGRFQEWETKYLKTAEAFATCRFIKHIGLTRPHDSIARIVSLHDRETKAVSGLKLA